MSPASSISRSATTRSGAISRSSDRIFHPRALRDIRGLSRWLSPEAPFSRKVKATG
jgi:hypothetical protein